MPTRLQQFAQRPWQGGLNTALDKALVPTEQLTRAENLIFDTSGSRKFRGGLPLWDYTAITTQRGSSGTTRTLVLDVNAGFSFSAGDEISVRTLSALDTDYDVQKVSIDTVDTVTYSPNVAITYTLTDSLTDTLGAATETVVSKWEVSDRIIGIYDFWYFFSGSKQRKIIGVSSQGNFYEYTTSGSKTIISTDTLNLTTPISDVSFATLGNKLIVAFTGSSNYPVIWDGSSNITLLTNTDWEDNDIEGTNPTPSLEKLRLHQQRIYATVSGDPDRVHYCGVNNPNQWNGEGDSGAIEVAVGDGDSTGFSSLFPSFKGRLGIAKGNKLYQLIGYAPFQQVEQISDGIGSESHNACVPIDQDDVMFISRRGFHSFAATDQFGDFSGAFLSRDIQPDFNGLDLTKLSTFKGVYFPTINSVAFIVAEDGEVTNNTLFLYNIVGQQWYKWTQNTGEFQIDSIGYYQFENKKQMLLGTLNGRVLKYDENFNYDLVDSDISYRIKSGIIYPDGNPNALKGFKEVGILYKTERDSVNFDLEVKIDNYDTQEITITQTPEGDVLGTTFVLGSSSLGFEEILLPYNQDVSGYGFGLEIDVRTTQPIEVYGYTVSFEQAGRQRQVDR